jgi:DNA mismatch endonuclease, patch repair protein
MVDVFTKAKRSEVMSRIKGRDTKPEIRLRKLLHARALRYRLGGCGLMGKPDIVLPRHRAALFVHGCFWHGHDDCQKFKLPSENSAFWAEKIEANRARDARAIAALAEAGWRVGVVWECALATKAGALDAASKVNEWLFGVSGELLELRGPEQPAATPSSSIDGANPH